MFWVRDFRLDGWALRREEVWLARSKGLAIELFWLMQAFRVLGSVCLMCQVLQGKVF